MKPQGKGTNSLLRAVRAAGFREKTTRKKRLTDRERTFKQLEAGCPRKILPAPSRRGDISLDIPFHRTSPFIGPPLPTILFPLNNLTISRGGKRRQESLMGGTSGSKELIPRKSVAGPPLHFRVPPQCFVPYVCSGHSLGWCIGCAPIHRAMPRRRCRHVFVDHAPCAHGSPLLPV
jgi:hypothetical protein